MDGFALARYPVTNEVFRCFVEDSGYAEACWCYGANQPVVGVTGYEAVAYCCCLTAVQNDGHVYRLPFEAEWERAARGPDGLRYPWGDDWDAGRANTSVLNLERSTPVGSFANGASV